MRDIKFRAWTGLKMIYRGLHDRNWYTEENSGKVVKGTNPNDKRNLKVMQFTGLKDKNGKEIYEGDILKVTDEEDEFEPLYYGEVTYNSEICMFLVGDNPFETAFTKIEFEVIGNIYDEN